MRTCFDTSPFIWSLPKKEWKDERAEAMARRTQAYVRDLAEKNAEILLPAPVVSEFFVKVDNEEEVLRLIETLFEICPLDGAAACLAGKLEGQLNNPSDARQEAGGRNRLRVDAMIAAIAIVRKADFLVTDNKSHFESLCGSYGVNVTEVPVVNTQSELWAP